jgi:hypothetical protein
MSNISRPTSFVDDATMVQNTRAQIMAKLRGLPKVDGQGREIGGPDVTVTAAVGTPVIEGQSPTMAEALQSAATALGVNLTALVDSERFVRALGTIEAGDAVALEAAINDAVTANPALAVARPSMQPNRAQGSSASGVIRSTPKTPQERILERLGNQPKVNNQGHTAL